MYMETVQDICDRNVHLEVRCVPCTRSVDIPPSLIPRRIPRDLPVQLAAAHFVCSGCGGRQLVRALWDYRTAKGRGR
ncbi:MAG: hypothetical protein AAGA00_01925 [Pseudomonadota bacterium]